MSEGEWGSIMDLVGVVMGKTWIRRSIKTLERDGGREGGWGERRGTLCHFLDPIEYQATRNEDFFHKTLFIFSKRNRKIKHYNKRATFPKPGSG
jgi:hypothetical protein